MTQKLWDFSLCGDEYAVAKNPVAHRASPAAIITNIGEGYSCVRERGLVRILAIVSTILKLPQTQRVFKNFADLFIGFRQAFRIPLVRWNIAG